MLKRAVLAAPQLASLTSWGLALRGLGGAAHSGRAAEPLWAQWVGGCGAAVRPGRSLRSRGLRRLGMTHTHTYIYIYTQVVVMMLWTKGLSLMLIEGTAPSMRQGPMYVRMLLFWAVSLTMAGKQ